MNAFSDVYYKTDGIVLKKTIMFRGSAMSPPNINQHIIISGHSDCEIIDELVKYYNPNIWCTVNNRSYDIRVYSLPLGITNNTNESFLHGVYGDLDIMIEIMNEPKNKINLLYMNFNVKTHPERSTVYKMFKNNDWVTEGVIENTIEGRRKFLRDIRNHKFVLCPRGNGIDTHRLWETLYMGSIPIVKKDIAYSQFTDLPICFIDSWEQITPNFLNDEYIRISSASWNMDKLKIGYWIDKMNKLKLLHRMNTGQIKLNQGIGKYIIKYANDLRFNKYFEIGTWNGGGSTLCVIAGLLRRSDTVYFKSIETNIEMYKSARTLLHDFKDANIELIHGRIFKDDEIPQFETIKRVHNNINRTWHEEDVINCKSAAYYDVNTYMPDVVILDGGEYMTYFEYLKVKNSVKVLILDDTSVSKCKKIVEELINDKSWKLIDCNPHERNGWHVFERLTDNV